MWRRSVAFATTLGPSLTLLEQSFSVKQVAHQRSHGAPRWGETRSRITTLNLTTLIHWKLNCIIRVLTRLFQRVILRHFRMNVQTKWRHIRTTSVKHRYRSGNVLLPMGCARQQDFVRNKAWRVHQPSDRSSCFISANLFGAAESRHGCVNQQQ